MIIYDPRRITEIIRSTLESINYKLHGIIDPSSTVPLEKSLIISEMHSYCMYGDVVVEGEIFAFGDLEVI